MRANIRLATDDHKKHSEAFTNAALHQFLNACISAPTEPPHKRRRIASTAGERPEANYVTLAKGSIELVTSHPTLGRNSEQVSSQGASIKVAFEPVRQRVAPVSIQQREDEDEDQKRVLLSFTDGTDERTIELFITYDDNNEVRHIVHDLLTLHRRPAPKSSVRATDIAFTETYLVALSTEAPSYFLEFKIQWMTGISASHYKSPWLHEIAQKYLPGSCHTAKHRWTPQDFYQNVHRPDPSIRPSETIQTKELETQLYPFQQRAVNWLLQREQVEIDEKGHIKEADLGEEHIPAGYRLRQDAFGNDIYVSHLEERVVTFHENKDQLRSLRGGILAEEMGLGKTVELITLMILHRRMQDRTEDMVDLYTGNTVTPSGATLIITPPHILEQWKSELSHHSPSLRVYHYEGLQKSHLKSQEWKEKLLKCDVVLTTYSVLSKEIHYANDAPKRDLRHAKAYQPRRTPLVQILWWRVCLDEAQMIESGVSNAAKVARLIPRENAWAVTGTPLRKDVTDLLGLLIFLRLEPFCRTDIWNRLVGGQFPDLFAEIFQKIAIRHSKTHLGKELALPPQQRVTITIPFTATEEQHYNDLHAQMCEEIGVDDSGAPLNGDWDPDHPAVVEKMRHWLTRLRQTCLHAEIGGSNRRALGSKMGPLRTVDEVLDVMLDQNETAMRSQERSVLSHKIMKGHQLSFGGQPRDALEAYLSALTEASITVDECREHVESAKRAEAHGKSTKPNVDKTSGNTSAHEGSHDIESDEEGDSDDRRSHLSLCKQRLRSSLELLHVCLFFSGTAYYQIKENKDLTKPDSADFKELEAKEVECYDKAKVVRKELLSPVTRKTSLLIDNIALARSKASFSLSPIRDFEHYRGLESRGAARTTQLLISSLNDYSEHLNKWRSKFSDLLVKKLVDHEDELEITGEEYETSTKEQDEQYVLLEIMRAAIADRHCILTGQANYLINGEMKRALKQAIDGAPGDLNEKGPAPDLFKEALAIRATVNPEANICVPPGVELPREPPVSLRGVLTDLRSMVTTVQWSNTERSRAEVQIIEQEIHAVQKMQSQIQKENEQLETELNLFRSTMNQRLEFYRQLQQISDAVAPLQEEMSETVDVTRLEEEQRKEESAATKLATFKTKRRFLLHLRDESSNKMEQKTCVICQEQFHTGVLTVCGHQYCKDCLLIWYNQHRSCPMCKRKLKSTDFHQVTYKPQELQARTEELVEEEYGDSSIASSPSRPSIYSNVKSSTLDEIRNVDLPGRSYAIKIDTISRHLLWLRQRDPGSKSIIFSQYREFLDVLGRAFESHKIGYSEIGSKQGIRRFREDPGIEAFLLHAKADSSGLNLVNATHVFLCEPLINTAIELQAIARVHRIGQQRPTTVWMYLINGTVEEAIYDISVTRRLAHMQRSNINSRQHSGRATPDVVKIEEDKLDAANSLELQSAPISKLMTSGQSGGEVVAKDDLWGCLFGKARKDHIVPVFKVAGEGDAASQEIGRFLRAEAADSRM